MGKQWKQRQTLFWGSSRLTADGDCSHEIKRHLLLGRKAIINLDSILKGRGTRDQIANICWIMEKAREFQKTSVSLTMPKPLTVWITINCGKFFKRWKYQITLPASWEICMLVKKQQLELDMEQQTGSKSGKEYVKAVYCHPAYLTYMQSTSCKMPGWMKHKLNQDCHEKHQ